MLVLISQIIGNTVFIALAEKNVEILDLKYGKRNLHSFQHNESEWKGK